MDSRGRLSPHFIAGVGGVLGNFFADGDAGDAELITASVVGLDEDADGVASEFGVEDAGRRGDAAFEFVAGHAVSGTDVALFDEPGVSAVEGVPAGRG